MQFDVNLVNLLVSTVLPFLVAVVTKKVTDSSVKAILLALFSALLAVGTRALAGDGVVDQATLYLGIQNFVVAIGLYMGLWKPTGTSEGVADKTDNVGLTIKSSK